MSPLQLENYLSYRSMGYTALSAYTLATRKFTKFEWIVSVYHGRTNCHAITTYGMGN
jgi:hypothetical protein